MSFITCSSQAFKRGGRPDARKVMIVITDGESHDSPDLKKAVEDSEKDNITLYGIAVSLLYLYNLFATYIIIYIVFFIISQYCKYIFAFV